MASVELDLDAQMNALESEWRHAFEDGIVARAEYQALAASREANADSLDSARERLDRAEALKAQIMVKIERLEYRLLGRS
jgi:chromosome segregation ATPase